MPTQSMLFEQKRCTGRDWL